MLGTSAAGRDAIVHISDALAVVRAGFADFGAQAAHLFVKLALVTHEVGRCRADRGAIDHQPEVLRFDMLAAHLEAVRHRSGEAGLVTGKAGIDAGFGFLAESMHDRLRGAPANLKPEAPLWFRAHVGFSRPVG